MNQVGERIAMWVPVVVRIVALGLVSADNIVRDLVAAGKSWKSYAEDLPSVGYTGGDAYPYAKRHNILAYFTDVVNSSTEKNNLVPFSQFASDVANSHLPNFSLI